MFGSSFITDFGAGTVYATESGVIKVEIPDMSRCGTFFSAPGCECDPSELTIQVSQMLQRYFHGEPIDFSEFPVVLEGFPRFHHNVLMKIRTLAYGDVCSYGHVAGLCGSPRAARAVGAALAANPVPVIIPCHRVVASSGRLTGFSAPGGEKTKSELLKMEGVKFKGLLVVKNQMVMHSG